MGKGSLELTRIGGKAAAGVLKDVVRLGGNQKAEVDFVADNPGPTLLHRHQQIHMDFGFMACSTASERRTRATVRVSSSVAR